MFYTQLKFQIKHMTVVGKYPPNCVFSEMTSELMFYSGSTDINMARRALLTIGLLAFTYCNSWPIELLWNLLR